MNTCNRLFTSAISMLNDPRSLSRFRSFAGKLLISFIVFLDLWKLIMVKSILAYLWDIVVVILALSKYPLTVPRIVSMVIGQFSFKHRWTAIVLHSALFAIRTQAIFFLLIALKELRSSRQTTLTLTALLAGYVILGYSIIHSKGHSLLSRLG